MYDFEKKIEAACAAGEIPGAVLLATDRTGSFTYTRTFGKRSVRPGADQSPLRPDAVMWIASCTKLITCVAVLQCVERGLLSLDGPVYDILPELRDVPVLDGPNEDGTLSSAPHKNVMTLRHLLTHSSGFAYDMIDPRLIAWSQAQGRGPSEAPRLVDRFAHPLVFEPGTSWVYGSGIDWAGQMVERVNGGVTLQEYFEKHIFEPLGAKDLAFHPYLKDRPEMMARLVDMSQREQGRLADFRQNNEKVKWEGDEDCFGGGGLFASPADYLKVLKGVLTTDENQNLLKKETAEMLFRPSLTDPVKKEFNKVLQDEQMNNMLGGMPMGISRNWGLGGMLIEADVPKGRKAYTMGWGGAPNLIWFIDRQTGICGLYASQLMPPGDAQTVELNLAFEAGVYEMYQHGTEKL